MNAKKAKALRRQFDNRDVSYMPCQFKTRKFGEGTQSVYLSVPAKPFRLNPNCGRAAYKAAKKAA